MHLTYRSIKNSIIFIIIANNFRIKFKSKIDLNYLIDILKNITLLLTELPASVLVLLSKGTIDEKI